MNENAMDLMQVGKRMVETAIDLEESLAELLRTEVRRLRLLIKSENALEQVHSANTLVRTIIMTITLTEERIRTGLELYLKNKQD